MRRVYIPIIAVVALSTAVCVANAQQEQPRVFSVAVATIEPGHMAEYMGILEESVIPLLEAQDVAVGIREGIEEFAVLGEVAVWAHEE